MTRGERSFQFVPIGILALVGVGMLCAGWWGVSHRADLGSQTAFIALAAIGLMVAAIADALVLMALRRAVDQRSALVDVLLRNWLGGGDV